MSEFVTDPSLLMKEEVKVPAVKKHTFMESLAWHLRSRRARLLLANLFVLVMVNVDAFKLTPDQAMLYGAYATAGFCTLIAALTGDKIGVLKLAEVLLVAMQKTEE